MIPQHSSPAPADSRCRDALQVNVCTEYKSVHLNGYITRRYSRHNALGRGLLSCCLPPCEIGGRTRNTEAFLHPPNELGLRAMDRPLTGCGSGSPRRISPIVKHIKFNRMNGSPGDPPANHMHISKQKGITPFIHRLASDPSGKEAGWETTT
jgi:hypothetical protein